MEVLKMWSIQDYVAKLPKGAAFGTMDVKQGVGLKPSSQVTYVLNEMNCVGIVHQTEPNVSGSSDKNIYSKLRDKDCSICPFERSGSSGCVIRRQDIKKIYEDNR